MTAPSPDEAAELVKWLRYEAEHAWRWKGGGSDEKIPLPNQARYSAAANLIERLVKERDIARQAGARAMREEACQALSMLPSRMRPIDQRLSIDFDDAIHAIRSLPAGVMGKEGRGDAPT